MDFEIRLQEGWACTYSQAENLDISIPILVSLDLYVVGQCSQASLQYLLISPYPKGVTRLTGFTWTPVAVEY